MQINICIWGERLIDWACRSHPVAEALEFDLGDLWVESVLLANLPVGEESLLAQAVDCAPANAKHLGDFICGCVTSGHSGAC